MYVCVRGIDKVEMRTPIICHWFFFLDIMDLGFSPHQDLQLDEYDSGRDAMTYHRTWMSMVGH